MKTYSGLIIPMLIGCVAANAGGKSLDAKHLIEIAERHDLPMPPANAHLVLAHTETWSVLGNQSTSRDPGIYSPAYILKEDADGSVRILRGAEQDTLQPRHNQEPLWRPFSTNKVEPKLGGYVASFSRLSAFVCAVQTATLGDQETAQAIWERFSAGEWWSKARSGEDIGAQLKDQKLLLGRCIFDHLRNALLKAGADRKVIHARMRSLLKEFPNKLPGLCAEFTAHAAADAQPYDLAEALAESSLSKEVRVRELSKFAERGSLEHRRCVLQNLVKLDEKACSALLLPILADLPKDATGPYWTCPQAGFTQVVVQIEDNEVWRAYLQVAKRSSIGLRMEMMNPLNYCYVGKKNLGRRLAFLSAFLDDDEVREMSRERGQFQGPCAGFTFPRLAVRDFAAMKLASLLDMKEAPDEFWTDVQWEELRRKVQERLAEQKLPEL